MWLRLMGEDPASQLSLFSLTSYESDPRRQFGTHGLGAWTSRRSPGGSSNSGKCMSQIHTNSKNPSVNSQNDGKTSFSMGQLTISMVTFKFANC